MRHTGLAEQFEFRVQVTVRWSQDIKNNLKREISVYLEENRTLTTHR